MQVEELAKAKLEKPKRLKEQAAKEWREIDDGTLVFRRPEAEVASLRQLTKADLAAFFVVSLAALQASCLRPVFLKASYLPVNIGWTRGVLSIMARRIPEWSSSGKSRLICV